MAYNHMRLLLVFLVVFACIQQGFSKYKCFRCYSTNMTDCASSEITKNTEVVQECPNHTDVCVKHVRSADMMSHETVMRGCVGKSYCDEVIAKYCGTCSEDYCNSSISLVPSLGFISILSLIKMFLL